MPGISLIRSCILEGLWHGLNTSKFVKNTPAANTSPDPIRIIILSLSSNVNHKLVTRNGKLHAQNIKTIIATLLAAYRSL